MLVPPRPRGPPPAECRLDAPRPLGRGASNRRNHAERGYENTY